MSKATSKKSKKLVAFTAGMAGILSFAGPAFAGNLSEQFSSCLTKFADPHRTVSVLLECTAAGGKLSDCKMVDGPSPADGFDKAAMCVADVLPIGDKTGTVKVPIRFQAS